MTTNPALVCPLWQGEQSSCRLSRSGVASLMWSISGLTPRHFLHLPPSRAKTVVSDRLRKSPLSFVVTAAENRGESDLQRFTNVRLLIAPVSQGTAAIPHELRFRLAQLGRESFGTDISWSQLRQATEDAALLVTRLFLGVDFTTLLRARLTTRRSDLRAPHGVASGRFSPVPRRRSAATSC